MTCPEPEDRHALREREALLVLLGHKIKGLESLPGAERILKRYDAETS
jgi:hypothetical protein